MYIYKYVYIYIITDDIRNVLRKQTYINKSLQHALDISVYVAIRISRYTHRPVCLYVVLRITICAVVWIYVYAFVCFYICRCI